VDFEKDTIKIESIKPEDNSTNFRTKNRKFRILKMPPYLQKYLEQLKNASRKSKN
jgi:hypothetical protein